MPFIKPTVEIRDERFDLSLKSTKENMTSHFEVQQDSSMELKERVIIRNNPDSNVVPNNLGATFYKDSNNVMRRQSVESSGFRFVDNEVHNDVFKVSHGYSAKQSGTGPMGTGSDISIQGTSLGFRSDGGVHFQSSQSHSVGSIHDNYGYNPNEVVIPPYSASLPFSPSSTEVEDKVCNSKDGGRIPASYSFGTNLTSEDQDRNIEVSLEKAELWQKFCHFGTEMILTKSGRLVVLVSNIQLSC